MRFELLTAVIMESVIFRDMTLCNLVEDKLVPDHDVTYQKRVHEKICISRLLL
jgi:hypothetical protein